MFTISRSKIAVFTAMLGEYFRKKEKLSVILLYISLLDFKTANLSKENVTHTRMVK